jgi:lipoate-protein ligase A
MICGNIISMRLLLYTARTPAEDLALEEAIHTAVEDDLSANTWRLWQAAIPAVVLGTGQEHVRETNLELARAREIPVLRRHSGGGAVVIGPGAINFSAFFRFADLPGSETIRGAMSAALKPVVAALARLGVQAREAGLSDLAVLSPDGTLRKLAGNSQARKKRGVVVHGTLLADPDFTFIESVLKFPTSVPDYRSGRDHRSFLTSLRELNARCDLKSFTNELIAELPSDILITTEASAEEQTRAARLLDEKYGNPAWNFRR